MRLSQQVAKTFICYVVTCHVEQNEVQSKRLGKWCTVETGAEARELIATGPVKELSRCERVLARFTSGIVV